MKCPYCGVDEDRVIDSRPAREGRATRRRRECSACSSRYTTYEAPEEQVVFVAKSDGNREPFDRNKVYRGISIACNKRPVALERIDQMTRAVEAAALAAEGNEVSSRQIGEWILGQLAGTDEVAYVRFASVFNRYGNVNEFVEELAKLNSGSRNSSQSG
ncbi:transcriptional repressor NrdR [candidate division KSB1 bacterium]|nr:transcriptional repressor NrdR [candidate division KSB1 bacterium]